MSSQPPLITSSQTAPPPPSMAPSSHPPQPIPPTGDGGGSVGASNGGTAAPTYNPFPPPSMGGYTPFGMPYFRPPHMMPGPGGAPPPPHAFGPLAPPPHIGPPGGTIGPSPSGVGPRPPQPPPGGSSQPQQQQGQGSSCAIQFCYNDMIVHSQGFPPPLPKLVHEDEKQVLMLQFQNTWITNGDSNVQMLFFANVWLSSRFKHAITVYMFIYNTRYTCNIASQSVCVGGGGEVELSRIYLILQLHTHTSCTSMRTHTHTHRCSSVLPTPATVAPPTCTHVCSLLSDAAPLLCPSSPADNHSTKGSCHSCCPGNHFGHTLCRGTC